MVQPTAVRTPACAQQIADADADIGVVIAYGRVLTPAVLAMLRMAPRRLPAPGVFAFKRGTASFIA